MTFSTPRRRRAALGLLAIAAFALTACTQDSDAPVITDAPSTTSTTVRVVAVGADQDAHLLSQASVEALTAQGLKAKEISGEQKDGWSAEEALTALRDGEVDVVFSGSSVLAAQAPAPVSGSSTAPGSSPEPGASTDPGAPVNPQQTESGGAPESGTASSGAQPSNSASAGAPVTVRTPPVDQTAAVAAATAVLPDGAAVASTAVKDRRPVLLATKAVASGKELATVSQAASACSTLSIATPEDWDQGWGKVWLTGLGCEPQGTTHPATTVDVTQDLLLGTVQLGIAESTDPGIFDLGLVALEDQGKALGADPVVAVVRKQAVGQDAIDIVNKVTAAAQGEDWTELRRVVDPLAEDQRGTDVGRWLVARGVLGGNEQGLPTTQSPASSSSP